MNTELSTPDITHKAYATLSRRLPEILPFAVGFFAVFFVANVVRGFFPGVYTFRPADEAWLLIPEVMVLGPLLALYHHRLLGGEREFAWSSSNRTLKFIKATVYCYALLGAFKLGFFAATEVVPALLGYVFGQAVVGFMPIVVAVGVGVFLCLYVRPLLAFCILAGEERQPLTTSLALTKGKSRRIVACLLLPAAPVIIAWVGAATYAPDMLEFSDAGSPRLVAITLVALVQTLGAVFIPPGLCAIYEILAANADRERDEAVVGHEPKDNDTQEP